MFNRWIRPIGALVIASGVAASGLLGMASPALAANPSGNHGCPSGYVAKTLEQWAALGYVKIPAEVDSAAFGGNHDDYACGNDLGKTEPDGLQLYQFTDNDVPG